MTMFIRIVSYAVAAAVVCTLVLVMIQSASMLAGS